MKITLQFDSKLIFVERRIMIEVLFSKSIHTLNVPRLI